MGGAVSAGETNAELVDNLVVAEYIKTGIVDKVFRAVDRGEYYLPDHRESAYKDLAWKHGNVHLSAPCIYAEVLESLQVGPGMSFLNLGSGTGYLSTMVGLIIGPYGINHGVEYHADVIEYARAHLDSFCRKAESFDEFEFCPPQFVQGNCLLLASSYRLYDRMYCGAACPSEFENYMKNLIKIGGVLVMPLNDQLLQITRTSETTWETKNVLPVSFASLIIPAVRDGGPVDLIDLPGASPMTLQDICRIAIRRILRRNIQIENPQLGRKRAKRAKRRLQVEKRRRINLVPMQASLMVLGQFGGESDSEGEEAQREYEREISHLDDVIHERARRRAASDEEDEDREYREVEDFSAAFFVRRRPNRREQARRAERRNEQHVDAENNEEDAGFIDGPGGQKYVSEENGVMEKKKVDPISVDNEKVEKDETKEVMHVEEEIKSIVEVEGIKIDGRNKNGGLCGRTYEGNGNGFSAASYSSSGIGTCGSLDAGEVGVASCDESSSPTNHRGEDSSDESLHAGGKGGESVERNGNMREGDDDEEQLARWRTDFFGPVRRHGRKAWQCFSDELLSPNLEDVLDFGKVEDVTTVGRASGERSRSVDGMGDVEENGEEKEKDDGKDGEEGGEGEECAPGVTYKRCMRAKVEKLPIPISLKNYILFFRN